jgi:hypothetical protein
MIELYFLLIRLPQMMSQLARERNRSAVGWSVIGIVAWIGAELAVFFVYGFIYAIGQAQWGWPEQQPGGVLFLIYVLALVAAILGAGIARRVLRSMPVNQPMPPPPPPPQF